MAPPTYQPDGKTIVGAVITVAAVYVYFLIFAQFGFLQAVQAVLGEGPGVIRPVMAVMGLAGVAGSVLAARVLTVAHGGRWLATGLVICAAAAAGSMAAQSSAAFYGVALLTGLGTGLTTVTLAGMLCRAIGGGRLGLVVGTGTGLAYAFCNLPAVFAARATTQAELALLAVALGLAGGRALGPRVTVDLPAGEDYDRNGTAAWVLVFCALVALDSAAFYIIQHTPALKEKLWDGAGQLVVNAGVHLGAALLAGWALDRRGLGPTVLVGAAALLAAGGLISGLSPVSAAGLLYITGVSAYSVALVYYPARSARPGLAALVYAVAGWGGSALGIGLAEGRHELPPGWLIAAGLVIGLGLGWRMINRRRAA